MVQTDKVLLSLVRCFVNGICDDCLLDLKKVDWSSLYTLSQNQSVAPVVADGLQTFISANPGITPLKDEYPETKNQRIKWLSQVVLYERLYAKHEKVIGNLARLHAGNGIRMMVLKGYGLSLDWPVPNHRPVGDLDIYNFGRWREADALVEERCGIKVYNGHEHHTVFSFKGVAVENHYDFINTKAHRDAPKIEAKLKTLAEKDCKEMEVQGAKIYLPSVDFNAIFLMRHLGQHFAGEHLTLRQVLDWGFFVRAHYMEVDWNGTIDFFNEIGLYAFFNQINSICIDYLGFEKCIFPVVESNKALEQRILLDILHPEFTEDKPNAGLLFILAFKFRRWWHNRWKSKLIFGDNLWITFLYLAWSHIKRINSIKD